MLFTGKKTYDRSTRADTFQKLHCFVEEDILLLACSGQAYLCCPEPEHKEFAIDEVAPNFLFIDMPHDKVLPRRFVEIERYLGQGCFGAVFSGFISDPQERMDDRIPVAHKFYQPINVEDRFQAPLGDKEAIHSKQKQWMLEPSYSIAEAYTELRKEASVLMELQHEFIVSFYGVSLSPIALILDKAPKGDLAEQLEKFKTENSLLPPPVIKDIIYQLSSALAYLHKHSYVHRDLKPANVLVWKFPDAQATMKELKGRQPVLVRLSDYGMTQKEISDQMLGRPGTPQYMAPEILQEDGREIFNNKIDIYSLGMIIYDCICLTPPWLSVNFLDFRTMVSENKRPMTTTAAKQSPVAFLDLMCYCTLPDPKRRPDAVELVELLQEQEVCKLIEIVELRTPQHFQVTNMGLSLVAGDGSPQAMNTIAITSLASVTSFRKHKKLESRNNPQVLDVTLLFYKDILRETINLQFDMSEISEDEVVTSVCCVYKTVWVGTHSLHTMDESLRVFQIVEGKLEEKACNSLESRITDIHHLTIDGPNGKFSCVAVVTENGQINLYKHQWEIHKEAGHNEMRPMRIATLEESGFTQINSLCLVIGRFELSRIPSISKIGNNPPRSPGSPRDHVKTLRIPQNLELWISGEKGNLKRFKILKTADGCCPGNEGLLLCFMYVNPVLRHDPESLFQGRLRVDKLLTLDSCRRVWSAGAESRNVYMWNVDNHQCKEIPCSNFFDNDRETHTRRSSSGDDMLSIRSSSRESHGFDSVVNAIDLKQLNYCVYVALNNGFIIVFHGQSGDQVNQFQSHTVDLCKMLPLDPIIAPPTSQVMEHYQDSFLKKDARYLTFGTGHTSLVELKHDATSEVEWQRPRRAETFGPDVFDEMDSLQTKNVLIKLWNQYGEELHKIKKRKPNLQKQETVTVINKTGSKFCPAEPRVNTPDLEVEPSMRAVLIPKELQESTAGLSPKERNQFLHILRFDEAATENLANATPSDDDRGNDEQSLPRSDVSRNNSLTRPINLPFHRNPKKRMKPNKKASHGSAPAVIPEPESVMVEVKESGFACHRFTLTAGGHEVEFTNGVKVKFQPSSVDLTSNRLISVIVSNPKINFPKSKQEFSYTSIVTILCDPKRDFHSEVSVTIPLIPRPDLETHTNLYTGFDLMPDNIFPIESNDQLTEDENIIEYRSNRFFLPIVGVSASSLTQLPKTLNLHTIFPEQLHVLLVYFKESSGKNSLHFSCLSMSRFLGVIRMMSLTNVQFHDIQLPYTLGARIEITAFSRTIYLDVSQNEIAVITDDKDQTSPKLKPKQIDYRFSVISPLNRNEEGFQQNYTYGRINVSSEINDQIIQKAVQRSIQSTNDKWVHLMKKFSFDDGNINDLIKHDNGEIFRRLSLFMTLEELQSVLKTLSPEQDVDFEKRNTAGVIDQIMTSHTYRRSHIEAALQQVDKFQCVLFSYEMSDYAANIAAKCLVEKYRFNLVRHASMLEIAMRADEVASSLRSDDS